MKNKARLLLVVIVLGVIGIAAPAILAQGGDSCPEMVNQALLAAESLCSTIGRDQVCYGNWLVTAQAKPNVTNFAFNNPGDVVSLGDVAGLELANHDQIANIWGVSLIRSQLNLANALPGQTMTLLLFGTGAEFQANENMSAFTFLAGLGAPTCAPVPTGLLLQSPAGQAVAMNINGVDVMLGSTVYVTSTPEQTSIGLVEGQAQLLANGVFRIFEPETMLDIPRNPDGSPGVPGLPYAMPPELLEQLQAPLHTLNTVVETSGQAASQSTGQSPALSDDKPVLQPAGDCLVSTLWDNVPIHVGPGEYRGVAAMMQPGFEYKAIGYNDQNGEWLQLDMAQLHFRASANELWVNAPSVDTSGNCDALGFAAAPPVIAAPRPQPSPTTPPITQPVEPVKPVEPVTGGDVSILYGADRYNLTEGECVNLYWNVQNVQAVYFEGQGVAGESNWVVCPEHTTTYTLRVIKTDGQTQEQSLTINVTPAPSSSGGSPSVSFWADEYEVENYSCTTVHWSTQNVESVYYEGHGVPGNGSEEVCPSHDTTYHLRVNKVGGGYEDHYVTIAIYYVPY